MTEDTDAFGGERSRSSRVTRAASAVAFLSVVFSVGLDLYQSGDLVVGALLSGAVLILVLGSLGEDAGFGFGYLDTMSRAAVVVVVLASIPAAVVFEPSVPFSTGLANALVGVSATATLVVVFWAVRSSS